MKTLFVLIAMFMVSCAPQTPKERRSHGESEASNLKRLIYFHDTRTEQCFAGYGLSSQYGQLTSVSCTGPVLDGAIDFKSNK